MPRKTKETNAEKTIKVATKNAASKKSTLKKETTTKKTTNTSKVSKSAKSTEDKKTKNRTSKSTSTSKTKLNTKKVTNVEYYDLPYKYNQTMVKILYQNPTTLFVYWEVSDKDIENYKNKYGENFFETTKPFLVVYNETMNYNFEIPINDFANSWYFNINDSKCDYKIELIRKPIDDNINIKSDIFISSSNEIESPNDRILFSTNEQNTVYFKNIKNNNKKNINLSNLLTSLNLSNKQDGFPLVKNIYDLFKFIYKVDNIEKFSEDLNNPSSGNPSSHSFTIRYN